MTTEIQSSELDRRITIIEMRNRVLKRKLSSIQITIKSIFLIASIACLISAAAPPNSKHDFLHLNMNVIDKEGRQRSYLNFDSRNQYNRVRFNGLTRNILAVFGCSFEAAQLEMSSEQSKKQFHLNLMSDGKLIASSRDEKGDLFEIELIPRMNR